MKQILYLEDDQALAFVTKRALEKRDFTVHHFLDIQSLISNYQQLSFDAVLLDLKIGNDSSLNLIQEIKRDYKAPVVILTGYGTIRTAVQAMKLGAINFLTKPCGIDDILQAFEGDSFKEVLSTPEHDTPLSLRKLEWEAIQKALDDNDGNVSAAARQLKMHRRTLQRKLQKRRIETDIQHG